MSDPAQNRRLAVIVAVATLAAFALRIWPPGRLGLDQFDEGIYALASRWILSPRGLAGIDPSLIPYAPPGYPILVGLASWLVGPSDQAGLLVSAALGALTVPVAAWVAGAILGPRAAVATAWCCCCSGPHIAFSRMGLTDASFLFAWSLAFAAGFRFLADPTWRRGLAMGGLVGLAQQFKYNGWLAGALVIATLAWGLVASREAGAGRYRVRALAWGGLGAFVAWMVVAPWYRYVDAHGGYAALLAHQRSYLGGPAAWWPHLRAQAGQAVALAGPAWLGIANALTIAIAVRLVGPWAAGERPWLRSWAAGGLAWPVLAAPATAGWLFIPGWLGGARVGERFLAVGWLVLFILSPFYHPYARLWLPLEFSHWIVLGGLAGRVATCPTTASVHRSSRLAALAPAGLLAVVAGGFLLRGPGFPFAPAGPLGHPALFGPSDSLRSAATEVARLVPPEVVGIRTMVRPALSYYLGDRLRIYPQADLDGLAASRDPRFWGLVDSTVVADPGRPQGRSLPDRFAAGWEVVAAIEAPTTLPTSLDLDPSGGSQPGGPPSATLWLIRRRTPETQP